MGLTHSSSPTATTVGHYRLLQRTGAGASGEVFLAVDVIKRRRVALKLFPPIDGNSAEAPDRQFEAETLALRSIRHPDIVEIFDAGHWQGRPWIAMEWLPGHDLSRYATRSRLLPEALVVQIGERLARALAHLHRHGIVHRDLKPGNVRVHLANDVVKLTDFGVARAPGASPTRTGEVIGSPAYMAPEQLAGAPASSGTDLYALGVVLFELLTGRRPHESESLGELLRRVATESAPDLREHRPDLPLALGEELARLLSKLPQMRHRDGDMLGDSLARARLHIGSVGVPPRVSQPSG